MRFTLLLFLAICALPASSYRALAAGESARQQRTSLLGSWDLVEIEQGGQRMSAPNDRTWCLSVHISAQKIRMTCFSSEDGEIAESDYKLVGSGKSTVIEMT